MKIVYTKTFARECKKLPRHFIDILSELHGFLENYTPQKSDSIGQKCFKIRFSPEGFQRGKSGGLRVIVFFYAKEDSLVPLAIFSKSKQENISVKYLTELLRLMCLEIESRG